MIVVDGRQYTSDLIIRPDDVVAGWWRKQGHVLEWPDLAAAIEVNPEVLIVGTGAAGAMRVADEVRERASRMGLELMVETTARAVETYNRVAPQKRAVAALHLTC